MKQDQLRQKTKLTKGLLIVALLFGLFAFLGDSTTYQARLELPTKTELVATNRPTFDQRKSASEQSKRLIPKRFFAYLTYSIVALLAYNKLINNQISRVCSAAPLTTLISKLFQSKTIPASSEAPHSISY